MAQKDVFIKAIQENERLIYKVASFYTEGKDDRDDLVQEIIYSLWKSFDTFKQHSSLSTWMYRVAMNVSISHLNIRKKRISTVSTELEGLNIADQELDDYEEKLHTLQMHIKNLNLFDKGILMLYLESKSHEESKSSTIIIVPPFPFET